MDDWTIMRKFLSLSLEEAETTTKSCYRDRIHEKGLMSVVKKLEREIFFLSRIEQLHQIERERKLDGKVQITQKRLKTMTLT